VAVAVLSSSTWFAEEVQGFQDIVSLPLVKEHNFEAGFQPTESASIDMSGNIVAQMPIKRRHLMRKSHQQFGIGVMQTAFLDSSSMPIKRRHLMRKSDQQFGTGVMRTAFLDSGSAAMVGQLQGATGAQGAASGSSYVSNVVHSGAAMQTGRLKTTIALDAMSSPGVTSVAKISAPREWKITGGFVALVSLFGLLFLCCVICSVLPILREDSDDSSGTSTSRPRHRRTTYADKCTIYLEKGQPQEQQNAGTADDRMAQKMADRYTKVEKGQTDGEGTSITSASAEVHTNSNQGTIGKQTA
jgi:hypothetical protein